MQVLDKNGNKVNLATEEYITNKIKEINIKTPKQISSIDQITETGTFVCNSNVPVGDMVLGKWTTGIVIHQLPFSYDAVMIAINSGGKLCIAYKNGDSWINTRII